MTPKLSHPGHICTNWGYPTICNFRKTLALNSNPSKKIPICPAIWSRRLPTPDPLSYQVPVPIISTNTFESCQVVANMLDVNDFSELSPFSILRLLQRIFRTPCRGGGLGWTPPLA